MAEELADDYVKMRKYNYIDATNYNIPWYLIFSFGGFPLYHLIIKKNGVIYKHLKKIGIKLIKSKISGYVYVAENKDYLLKAVNYRYSVDKNDNLNEYLDFSILKLDSNYKNERIYKSIKNLSIKVNSYYFGNLIDYKDWNPNKKILEIANKYMKP